MSQIVISDQQEKLDIAMVVDYLSNHSYWAKNIPASLMKKAIINSLCFGVYVDDEQVGFARVITDKATFANLVDVFILPEHQNMGYAGLLMTFIMRHQDLQGLRRFSLATSDKQGFYRKYGFDTVTSPDKLMEIHVANCYGANG